MVLQCFVPSTFTRCTAFKAQMLSSTNVQLPEFGFPASAMKLGGLEVIGNRKRPITVSMWPVS